MAAFFKVDHDRYGKVIEAYKSWMGLTGGSFNTPPMASTGIEHGEELIRALEGFVCDPLRGVVHAGRDNELKIILDKLYVAFGNANKYATGHKNGRWLITQKEKVGSLADKLGYEGPRRKEA